MPDGFDSRPGVRTWNRTPPASSTARLFIRAGVGPRMVRPRLIRVLLVPVVPSPRGILVLPGRRLDQLLKCRLHDLVARRAGPLVTDHSLVVDQVKRRRGG